MPPRRRELAALAHVREKVPDQQGDVLAPPAQRRQPERDDAKTEEQVLPEQAATDQLIERAVRGGQAPDVDGPAAVAADAQHLPFLEQAQKMGLQLGRHVADLVEQHRPALRTLEQPRLAAALGTGERPFLVAEELDLDQRRRDGREVDRQKRRGAPTRDSVDSLGEHLLARA